MALKLTGVGSYSTVYVDEEGNEKRIRLFHGQDVELLGLPEETLQRLRKLTVRRAGRNVPYFTDDSPVTVAEVPPVKAPLPVEENTGAITYKNFAEDRKVSNEKLEGKVTEEVVTTQEQPEEVKVEETETAVEEKPKAKKPAAKKKSTTKKAPAKKKSAPKKKTEE